MALIPTTAAQIAEFADALYGVELGNSTYNFVNNDVTLMGGLNNALNSFYTYSFGSQTTAAVAATVVNNVGIIAGNYGLAATDVTAATAYVQAMLDAAAPNQRGAVINSILNGFSTLNTGVYAQAAAAWQGTVQQITTYMGVSTNTTDLPLTAGVPLTNVTVYNLTTGMDNITAGSNSTINGTLMTPGTGVANTSTFTALDKIVATGTGNTLNLSDLGGAALGAGTAFPAGTSVSGVQTVNYVSAVATAAANFSGYTGLTALNVTEIGGAAGITAAGTTAVTLTDLAAAATTIIVQGGSNDSVTANGVTGAGTITVGSTSAPAGTIAITENVKASGTGGYVADAIGSTGGTTVTINANLTEAAGLGNTVTGGAITVTGGAATTTVTVNQTAVATASAAVVAAAGVAATVVAVPAAPGVQAVAATTKTTATAAAAAVAGVADGAVTISDANATSATLANTITSVTLANYATGSAINDNALTTLSLTNGTGTLTLTNAATTPTNTTLGLTLNGTSGTVADANKEIKTLNVTTANNDSTLTFTDSKLTTLNVSGTNTLTLGGLGGATIGTIAVSGSAGFNDGGFLAAEGSSLKSFTTTSSGTITATLDDTTQTFVGSTGQDIITVAAAATTAITGGSATNNELILNTLAATVGTTKSLANLTNFTTLGVTAAVTDTVDFSVYKGFNAIDVTASAGVTFVKAAAGTTLAIDQATTGTISLAYADVTGASDTTSLTLNTAGTPSTNMTVAALTLQDANAVGIATLNVVSNGSDLGISGGALNTITTLTDNGLSHLNVSGGAGLTIVGLNEATTQATAFTINSAETGILGTTITTFTDNNLGSLTFTGTNASDIGSLVTGAGTVTTIVMANTGTGTATVGDGVAFTDAILTSLTLTGSVNLTTGVLAATTGITVSGATDNAHVTISLAGAAAGKTDTITLGNANDSITDASTAGTVNVTAGTGSNLIALGTAATDAATAAYAVTLGAHTAAGYDNIQIGGAYSAATTTTSVVLPTAQNLTVTGAVKGDWISFSNDATGAITVTATTTATTAGSTAAATITAVETAAGASAHGFAFSVFGGNTYVAEANAALVTNGANAANLLTVVELVGTHTFTGATGHVVLAS